MNRGHDGVAVFTETEEKERFLHLLKATSQTNRIRIFAYCLMDNHYHLVLENSSGNMSDFLKQLNGRYATWYRRKEEGRGYVFQDRYKSVLIQDDSYLLAVLSYVLNNPVRAELAEKFLDYPWSSACLYFKSEPPGWLDTRYVEELFGSPSNFHRQINLSVDRQLPVLNTRAGKIIGNKAFAEAALRKFDRRSEHKPIAEKKRIDDYYFDPVEKVYQEFRSIHGVDTDKLDTSTHRGKRLRGNLLVYLKDKAGLKYAEIITIPIFSDLKMHSLGKLYKDAKARMAKG